MICTTKLADFCFLFHLFTDIFYCQKRKKSIMSSNNDNCLLITAGYDRTIRFWNPSTATIYRTIMHEDSVRNLRGKEKFDNLNA